MRLADNSPFDLPGPAMDSLFVKGARTHNLKNIDLTIPRDKLVVITGLSGSGKSSLAFDTLYAEGQRRYVESLSTYARQFLSMMEKPDVDHIEGLSPAISIEQKSTSHNPRSTVGTITEIHDYLRLLFARAGEPFCPEHRVRLEARTVSQMVDQALALPEGTRIMVLAPVVRERKGEHVHVFNELRAAGFIRARVDGLVCEIEYPPELEKNRKHTIEAVIDRLRVRPEQAQRLAESFETALQLSDGIAIVANIDAEDASSDLVFSARFACPHCGHSIRELEPRLFSFNNPAGACPACDGLGVREFFDEARVVQDPERSLAQGAIFGWEPRNFWYYSILQALSEHYGFSLKVPFKQLSSRHRDLILNGNKGEVIEFRYVNDRGTTFARQRSFEGVIPNIARRYGETDSERVRSALARYISFQACPDCGGARLREDARHVFIEGCSLPDISAMTVARAAQYFEELRLEGKRGRIAEKVLKELQQRLRFLVDVGLNYLTLDRSAETLSGGEAQRIRLASQIGAGLVGVMYILDEPSIGLHQRDNGRLLKTLTRLRDLGNTVLVVEHDEEAIRQADHVIDIGPGAGVHGGTVVAEGPVSAIESCAESITGQYLSGKETIVAPRERTPRDCERLLVIEGARGNNLREIDVELPLGLFTCVTGVSGSGKSTLVNRTLYPLAATRLNRAQSLSPAPYESISGLQWLDKVVDIDQSPIGRTPRSNPATYTGLFSPVRDLFAATAEARSRGYKPGRFSFNVKGGRCDACQGDGVIKVEMHFLPDIYVTCDICRGKRYNRETLEVKYKGKDIHQVLDMTVEEARQFFDAIPAVAGKLQTLLDVGLSYIRLGQAATTLSGGEAQRVKLSRELSRRDTGSTLYILDEPTTGLHFHDIRQLLKVLHRLRDHGNTIIVVEHNLDVIKTADWIIDLGPEGGGEGGRIVTSGTPEQVAAVPASHTGRYLQNVLPSTPAQDLEEAV